MQSSKKLKSRVSELEYAIYPSRLCLSIVGVWPNLNDSRSYAIASNIVFTVSSLVIIWFVVMSQTWKVFLVGNDLDSIVDILCTADIPVVVALIKMTVLRYYSEVVKSLLKNVIADWHKAYSPEHSVIIHQSARMGRWIALACVGTAYFTSNVFFVVRLFLLREKQMRTGIRPMLFESHFPVNVSSSPWFEITWCMQAITAMSATTAYSGIDGFFAVLVLHVCGQLTVLNDQLMRLVEQRAHERVADRIKRIATKHNQLNKFAETIERTFNLMFLAQIMACAIQFCLQGYQLVSILMDTTTKLPILQLIFMTFFIFYMSLDLYIYCYVAEKLRAKSLKLSHAVYNCNWYNLKPKEAYDLMFIANRAQYPLQITAGKFCSLSLGLFAVVGKTSVGYLSMLLAIKERTLAA